VWDCERAASEGLDGRCDVHLEGVRPAQLEEGSEMVIRFVLMESLWTKTELSSDTCQESQSPGTYLTPVIESWMILRYVCASWLGTQVGRCKLDVRCEDVKRLHSPRGSVGFHCVNINGVLQEH
jgi:hypothetical protein